MVLMEGSKGYAVESLQEILQQLGFYSGAITGTYDKQTKQAVALFQEKYLLSITGIADDRTQLIAAMKASVVRD